MKLLTLLLVTITTVSYAQDKGTTITEYNYLTKGYKLDIETGRDIKNGYYFEELNNLEVDRYKFNFKMFIREEDETLAGTLVIAKSNYSGNLYYLCIPIGNSQELSNKYFSSFSNWDSRMSRAYAYANSMIFSHLLGELATLSEEGK